MASRQRENVLKTMISLRCADAGFWKPRFVPPVLFD